MGVATLMLLAGCVAPPPATTTAHGAGDAMAAAIESSGRAMVRTELVFRLFREDGSVVAEHEWEAFVDESVVSAFPGGFTAVDGVTRGRDHTDKVVEKRAKLLIILHEGRPESLASIDRVCARYRQQFGQQSILRINSRAWVAF